MDRFRKRVNASNSTLAYPISTVSKRLLHEQHERSAMLFSVYVLLVLVLLLPWIVKRVVFVKMVEKLPGPPAYPLIGTLLPFILAPRNARFELMKKRVDEYKPFFRAWIGPMPTINLTSPHHAEILLSTTKNNEKSFIYRFLHPWLGTGLLTSKGQKWHTHRKMITPTFHFKILEHFVEVFAEKCEIMIQKLRKEAQGDIFDVYPYITRCTLDIICETAMGTAVHAQEEADSEYVSAIYNMSSSIVERMLHPWEHPDFVFKLTKNGRKHDQYLQILHNFTNKVIQDRKLKHSRKDTPVQNLADKDDNTIGEKKRIAFLDMLLEASEDGVQLTDEEIREEVDTFMFEGHDTTTAAICWALFLLGHNHQIQETAFKELESIFGGSDRPATMRDLQEMKYLERVIKETLRLYPSVPMISRKCEQNMEIDGYIVPAGCTLNLHIFMLHRNVEEFPEPENFNPDNFLPERVLKRHPYAYVPFSAGPRNCIGQKFALLEEKMVLSALLRHYRVKAVDDLDKVHITGELVLRPESGIRLCITPRR